MFNGWGRVDQGSMAFGGGGHAGNTSKLISSAATQSSNGPSPVELGFTTAAPPVGGAGLVMKGKDCDDAGLSVGGLATGAGSQYIMSTKDGR